MTPDGEPDAASGDEHAVHFRRRPGGGAPDAPEARDDVEGLVAPRQRVHVADSQVGFGAAVAGDRQKTGRRVDSGAVGATQPGQLDREARTAGHVEQAIPSADAKVLVEGDVLAAVGRLGEGGELGRSTTPALVDASPGLVGLVAERGLGHRPASNSAQGEKAVETSPGMGSSRSYDPQAASASAIDMCVTSRPGKRSGG